MWTPEIENNGDLNSIRRLNRSFERIDRTKVLHYDNNHIIPIFVRTYYNDQYIKIGDCLPYINTIVPKLDYSPASFFKFGFDGDHSRGLLQISIKGVVFRTALGYVEKEDSTILACIYIKRNHIDTGNLNLDRYSLFINKAVFNTEIKCPICDYIVKKILPFYSNLGIDINIGSNLDTLWYTPVDYIGDNIDNLNNNIYRALVDKKDRIVPSTIENYKFFSNLNLVNTDVSNLFRQS